ncbi:MAG TPA: hypothetical protein VM238_05110 [Phycisphaerae bacterium]|nr:hypothetical protein [Phycisphaerae bacterium]
MLRVRCLPGMGLCLALAALSAAAGAAEADEHAEEVVALRQKEYSAAGGDRTEPGEALIDALLVLVDVKAAAGAIPEAATACVRARNIGRSIQSERLKAIETRTQQLAHRMKAGREADALRKQLEQDPTQAATRETLVRLYLVDLDRPAEAARYVDGVADVSLRKFVPAAARGVDAAPELACKELGHWFRGLGEDAPDPAKAGVYARAKAYYERFLSVHAAEDLDRTAVTLALKQVDEELARLGGELERPLVDLLKLDLAFPRVDDHRCECRRTTDGLLINDGEARTPFTTARDYRLETEFTCQVVSPAVGVQLPVGSTGVRLFLQYYGTAAGLNYISGKDCRTNASRAAPVQLDTKQRHTVAVEVRRDKGRARITATLDGEPYVEWEGLESVLRPWMEEKPVEKVPFEVSAWNTAVVFHRCRVRLLPVGTSR